MNKFEGVKKIVPSRFEDHEDLIPKFLTKSL